MSDNNTLTIEQAQAEIIRLREENLRLSAKAKRGAPPVTFKVNTKGGVSVYGLGRFPVNLYVSQMDRLMGERERYEAFKAANATTLAVKPEAA
jgi:hypothetical protein